MGDSALFTLVLSFISTLLTLGVIALCWTRLYTNIALIVLVGSLVSGQLLRLPILGQGGGILPTDIALILTALAAVVSIYKKKTISPLYIVIGVMSSLFLLWSLLSVIVSIFTIPAVETLVGISYWVRLGSVLFLFPSLLVISQEHKKSLLMYAKIGGAVLIILGFFQYFFVSDISFLSSSGWDPHKGRLVSTWLDPNYFGAFCILYILLLIPGIKKYPITTAVTVVAASLALVLTQSRASWIAAISLMVLTPFFFINLQKKISSTTIKMVVGGLMSLVIVLSITVGIFFSNRIQGLVTGDATTQLRFNSLQSTWYKIVEPNWIRGVGYNVFGFYAREEGLISNKLIHSRAGTDNTLLTLWATTGVVGLILVSGIGSVIGGVIGRTWLQSLSFTSLMVIFGMFSLLVHSLFINSLLYVHLLVFLIILIVIGWPQKSTV